MTASFSKSLLLLLVFIPALFAIPALPARTSYNEIEARALLSLAAGAYALTPDGCVNRTFLSTNPRLLYATTKKVCDEFANLCGFYALADDANRHLYVVFRGTKTKAQLLTEGWHSLKPSVDFHGHGKAHSYFSHALNTLWLDVQKGLQDHPNYFVTFTGHSLGGALASLAALRTAILGIRSSAQIKLITFGQPRVGNVALAESHNRLVPTSFRVVHGVDIVPHLPGCAKPDFIGETYSRPCDANDRSKPYHHGVEIYYPHEMEPNSPYYECLGDSIGEDFNCSDKLAFKVENYFQYIHAHRHYFEHKVPAFGKLGCAGTRDQEEKLSNDAETVHEVKTSPWSRVKSKLHSIGNLFG